jgi:hypothetical protein
MAPKKAPPRIPKPSKITSEIVFFTLPIARLRSIPAECLCHVEQRLFPNAFTVNVGLTETW